MSQIEMSMITAMTLVIYGFIMRHERMKRRLAKQRAASGEVSRKSTRRPAGAPLSDGLFMLKLALASLQLPGRKLG